MSRSTDVTPINIEFHPQRFPEMTMPNGYLNRDPACQALWYYATTHLYVEHKRNDNLKHIEHEWPDVVDYRQLFTSIATMYGVQPERMIKFWVNVDLQMKRMGSQLRVAEEWRFRKTPEIRTQ